MFTNGYCHQRTGARFFRKLILLAGLSIISLTSTLAAPDRNDQAENSITESNVRSAGTPGAAEKSDEDFSDDPRHWFRGPDYQSFLQQSPEGFVPLELAVVSDLQIAGNQNSVIGLRFSLFAGLNRNLYGLDLGAVNNIADTSVGIRLGAVNRTGHDQYGVEVGGLNASGQTLGLQLGIINRTDALYGYQLGLANIVEESAFLPMTGALFNATETAYMGQFSLGANVATRSPFQFAALLNSQRGSANKQDVSPIRILLQVSLGLNVGYKTPFQISGIGNGTRGAYLQFAGGFNDADHTWMQLSGIFNYSDSVYLQIGGLNRSEDVAMQIGWLGNFLWQKSSVQVGGLFNWGKDSPLQIGLGFNAGGDVQLAGFFNTANSPTFQMSALVNSASYGAVQIGGLFNLSKNMRVQTAGLYNLSDESYWQFSLVGNRAKKGKVQISAGWNSGDASLQFGLLNTSEFSQFSLGAINVTNEAFGFRLAAINRSEKQSGLDVGILNDTKILRGHQVGLINISRNGGLPFTILYNYGSEDSQEESTGLMQAAYTPFQFSIYMPGQLFARETEVRGLRLNLAYSENADVYGLDVGPVQVSQDVAGAQVHLVSVSEGSVDGVQLGLSSSVDGSFRGAQVGVFSAVEQDFSGVQLGGFNTAASGKGVFVGLLYQKFTGDLDGFVFSPIAITEGELTGYQIGLFYNSADDFPLLQLGGVNDAEYAPIQLGLLGNIRRKGSFGPQLATGFNFSWEGAIFQISGLGNSTKNGTLFQLSGFWNSARHVYGLQITAGFNGDTDIVYGIQLSGIGNFANQGSALQLAGGFNSGNGYDGSTPVQLAGVANFGWDDSFLQIAGGFNFAEKRVAFQLAGLFNLGPDQERDYEIQSPFFQGSVLFNRSENTPIQMALINYSEERTILQIGAANIFQRGNVQIGAYNSGQLAPGVRMGFMNHGHGGPFQFAAINIHSSGPAYGVSIGAWNFADEYNGIMLGVFNYAKDLDGVQIGLLNINRTGTLPVMPLFNF
ncbi:MAG: hypothetical protein CMN76_11290 [Spirochaetaceae bacterium]|nr:hypothetical protein [Spirochaetaceae bacterium]